MLSISLSPLEIPKRSMSQSSQQWREFQSLERRHSQMSGRSGVSNHYLDEDEVTSLAPSVMSARGTSATSARAMNIMGYYEVDPTQVLDRLRAASGGAIRARSEQSSATSGWKEQTIHEPLVESQRTLPKPKGSTGASGVFESRSVYDPIDIDEGRSVRGHSVATSHASPVSYRLETAYGGQAAEPEYEAMSSPRFLQRSVLSSLHQGGADFSHLTPRRALPSHYALSADQMDVVEPADVRWSRSRDRSEDSVNEYVPLLEAPLSIPNTPTEQSEEDESEGLSAATDDLMQLEIYTEEEKLEQKRAAKVATWQQAFGTLKWQQTDEEIQLRAKDRAAARAASINAAQSPNSPTAVLGGVLNPFKPSFGDSTTEPTVVSSKKDKDKKDKKDKKGDKDVSPGMVEPPYNPTNPAEYQEFLYFQANSVASPTFMRTAPIVRLPDPRDMTAVLHDPLSTGTMIWDPFHSLTWWEVGKSSDDVIRIAGVTSGHEDSATGVPTYVDRFNNLTYGSYAVHPTRMWMVEYLSEKFPGHDHPILHTIDNLLKEHLDDVFALEKLLVDQFGRPQSYMACPPSLRFNIKYPSDSKRKFKPLSSGIPVDIVQGGMRSAPKDKKDKKDKPKKSDADDEKKDKKSKKDDTDVDPPKDKADKKDKTKEKDEPKTKEKTKEKSKDKTVEKVDKKAGAKPDKVEKADKKAKADKKDKSDKPAEKSDKKEKADKKDKSDKAAKPDKAAKADKVDKADKKADKKEKGDKKEKKK